MNERLKGLFNGFAGGLISSICCITPLILLLLGIGNISLAATMGAYRLYFILLGLIFVILSIGYQIRKKMKNCACSSVQMLRQESKLIFTAFASFFIVFGIINFLVLPYATAKINPKNDVSAEMDNSFKQLKLKIDGMTCEGCAVAIESALEKVDGIIKADVSYDNGTAVIIYNPSVINPQQIVDSVPEPYLAKIISNEDVKE